MKIRITTPIIAVLIGTAFVITGFGPTKISLISETFGGGVSGNRTNATNTAALPAVIQKGAMSMQSVSSTNDVKTTTTNNNITLGNPFYVGYDKITSRVPVLLNGAGHAIAITFSGNGTIKGISFTEVGRALIVPVSKIIEDIFGGVAIKATAGGGQGIGTAMLTFRELGHTNPAAGTTQGSGAVIFNTNATGNLAFLSNTVAIFKHTGNKDGTDTIKAWEWKYR